MAHDLLPISVLAESPFNYRLTFNPVKLQELADSIAAVGILQPIVVRPITQTDIEHQYEVVAGHRRLRAAKLAGLEQMPVVIKEMSDEQARLVQLHENIQREDPNPIEEAMGLFALKTEFKVDVRQLMKDTGKSKSYIYNRLRLATLTGRARELCLIGQLDAEIATLIATLPEALHDKALEKLQDYGSTKDQPKFVSYKSAQDRMGSFTQELEDTSFDKEDPLLYPSAGACGNCPHNSSNDTGLEALGPDVCTRTECFGTKQRIHFVRFVETAKAADTHTVIEGQEAVDIRRSTINRPRVVQGSVAVPGSSPMQWTTYEKILADMKADGLPLPKLLLVVDKETNEPTEMLCAEDEKKVMAYLRAKHPSTPLTAAQAQAGAHGSHKDDDDDAPDTPGAKVVLFHWPDVRKAIMRKAACQARTTDELRMLLVLLLDLMDEVPDAVADLMGWDDELADIDYDEVPKWFKDKISGMSADELGTLLVCMALNEMPTPTHSDRQTYEARMELASAYGVNVLALQANELDGASSAGNQAAVGGDLVDQMEDADA